MNSLKIDQKGLELARKQFCLDIGMSWEEYTANSRQNIFIRKAVYREGSCLNATEGSRNYEGRDDFFHAIICLGQLFLIVDEQLYDWAVEQFGGCAPEWFCEYGNLRRIDDKLREYNHQIKDTHVYYLPEHEEVQKLADGAGVLFTGYVDTAEQNRRFQWYEQEEILSFKEGNRFTSAICFSKTQPDIFAVAAVDEETDGVSGKIYDQSQMTGMAGVSADGQYLWQIGINVDVKERGKGLASTLVRLMKERVQATGKVPFYGTSESHSISQTVGLKAGFVPAWAEVFVEQR